jgi:UDP-N-acetyl-D-glucosamine dehydrogenase
MHRPAEAAPFLARLAAKDVTIGVIGLGYTGLPLAVASAQAGFITVGFDIDEERCAHLNKGTSHITDVTDEMLAEVRRAGRFTAVASGLAPVPDVVFMCVPTPFEQFPDLSYVRAAARTVGQALRPGMVVIAQSTSYPGTTAEVIQPLLEAGGLVAGKDFALAFCPERIDPGNASWTIHSTPRIIGGVTPGCTSTAAAVLAEVLGDPALVRPVSSPAVAEFAKLLENSYRLVNIALVNELAMLAHRMGIDIGEVIGAAATKPYGFQPFYPGVGPGGACIPEDPRYLAWKAGSLEFTTRLIDLAVEQNQGMARYVFSRILEMADRRNIVLAGSRILCIGAAYKPGITDVRHSRALRVMELLTDFGADVDFCDPLVSSVQLAGQEIKSVALASADPADYRLVAVLVARSSDVDLDRFLTGGVPVFDAAHALPWPAGGDVERLLTGRSLAGPGEPLPARRSSPGRANGPAGPSASVAADAERGEHHQHGRGGGEQPVAGHDYHREAALRRSGRARQCGLARGRDPAEKHGRAEHRDQSEDGHRRPRQDVAVKDQVRDPDPQPGHGQAQVPEDHHRRQPARGSAVGGHIVLDEPHRQHVEPGKNGAKPGN